MKLNPQFQNHCRLGFLDSCNRSFCYHISSIIEQTSNQNHHLFLCSSHLRLSIIFILSKISSISVACPFLLLIYSFVNYILNDNFTLCNSLFFQTFPYKMKIWIKIPHLPFLIDQLGNILENQNILASIYMPPSSQLNHWKYG